MLVLVLVLVLVEWGGVAGAVSPRRVFLGEGKGRGGGHYLVLVSKLSKRDLVFFFGLVNFSFPLVFFFGIGL